MARAIENKGPSSLWERPDLRTPFMEGLTAYGPAAAVLGIGAASGLLLAPLGLPVWFAVNCLFTDRINWPVDLAECRPLPAFTAGEWTLALGWFALIGAVYMLIFRVSIRSAKVIRVGPAALHPGHIFALLAAAVTVAIMSTAYGDPGVSRSEALVLIVSGPVWLRLWWSVRLRAFAHFARRRPPEACAWTVKVLLARQFRLKSPGMVDVRLDADERMAERALPAKLVVTGPFDAVDERRILDLAKTRLSEVASGIAVSTTLSAGDFWRPYREELGPSGYISPPIPAPLAIPAPILWLAGLAAALVWGFALWVGGLSPAQDGHLEAAIFSISRDLEQMEAGLDPAKETGVDTSFYLINLRDSKTACPELSRDVMGRWRLWNESHDDRFVYRVHQVSQVDFYGFVIDGAARACVRQAPGRSLREAQYLIASRSSAHEWIRIGDGMDWRYVPPRPLAVR